MTITEATRSPLSWPTGWPRTKYRGHAKFGKTSRSESGYAGKKQLTISQAVERLEGELDRLRAGPTRVLSTNLILRMDGMPRSDQREPADPGAAVYFKLKGADRVLACDRWNRVADNIAAIAAHIEAMRAVERYGVGSLEQAFAGYAALPQKASDWRTILEVGTGPVNRQIVSEAHARLAKLHHPDRGGTFDTMTKINVARDEAFRELQQEGR